MFQTRPAVSVSRPSAVSIPSGPRQPVAGASALVCRAAVGVVAAESAMPVEILLANHRSTASVAQARQLAMYLAHVALGQPRNEVARAFGRDRTTVAHACRRIEDMRDAVAFDDVVNRLEFCLRWIVKG